MIDKFDMIIAEIDRLIDKYQLAEPGKEDEFKEICYCLSNLKDFIRLQIS